MKPKSPERKWSMTKYWLNTGNYWLNITKTTKYMSTNRRNIIFSESTKTSTNIVRVRGSLGWGEYRGGGNWGVWGGVGPLSRKLKFMIKSHLLLMSPPHWQTLQNPKFRPLENVYTSRLSTVKPNPCNDHIYYFQTSESLNLIPRKGRGAVGNYYPIIESRAPKALAARPLGLFTSDIYSSRLGTNTNRLPLASNISCANG
jgi:hypothetical protein